MIQPVSWAGSNCKGRASSRHVKEPFILRITGSETSAGSDHVTSAAVFFHHGCKRFKLIRCLSGYVRCTLLRNLKQLCIESPTGVFGYPCLGTLKPVRSTASGRESSGRDKCTPVLAAGKKPSAARESGSPFFRRRAPQQPETRHSFPRPRKTRWIQRIRRGPSHIADGRRSGRRGLEPAGRNRLRRIYNGGPTLPAMPCPDCGTREETIRWV